MKLLNPEEVAKQLGIAKDSVRKLKISRIHLPLADQWKYRYRQEDVDEYQRRKEIPDREKQ